MKSSIFKKLNSDKIHFLPLGGCAEFGTHCNLYMHNGRILVIDMGIGFPDETAPGVDVLLPDIDFLEDHKDRIDGLVITHSHEDHIGAIHYLWDRIECPIYATKHDMTVLKRKFSEIETKVPPSVFKTVENGSEFDVGSFHIEMIRTAHSTPDSSMVLITAANGEKILHTGDWKIDADPVIGPVTDVERLARLGDENVLALMGDSTNIVYEGSSKSEISLFDGFVDEFHAANGRVMIACISSSMARIKNIMHAADKAGRRVSLVGRSLWTRYGIAREMGYFDGILPALQPEEGLALADNNIIFIGTGSQGEGRAAMPRIIHGTHHQIRMKPSDTIMFSARIIPGNERSILAMQSAVLKAKCKLITPAEANIYTSGHPCKEEVRKLYGWVKPAIAVPVHGDHSVVSEHAKVAAEFGIEHVTTPNNGDIYELSREHGARVVGHIETGVLATDGNRLIVADESEILRERRKMSEEGTASLSLVLTGGRLEQSAVDTLGLVEDDNELNVFHQKMLAQVEHIINRMDHKKRLNDDLLYEEARVTVRRYIKEALGKHPMIIVHIHRM